jgi:hypothetical protein
MQHHIIKSLAAIVLGAMLLTAFRPMPKGEHELVGSWQYVKSAVAIHWDNPAPFHDSAAQDEERSERKDMTINADGSGEYTFDQSGYHESYPFTISSEDNRFTVDIPEDNLLHITECGGTWTLEEGKLLLDITTVFANGRSYSYTAECVKE